MTEEDGVAAGVGVEQAIAVTAVEQGGVEAAGGEQEVAHAGPEAVVTGRELQAGGAGNGRGGWRREAAGEAFEELDGGLEAAAAGVHDEVDGAAAAGATAVVEEAAAGDAQDGAGEFPAGRVAGVGTVAELAGERFEGGVADALGALALLASYLFRQ